MNNQNIKLILAHIIGLMPTNKIRSFLYRTLFGYKIYKSYIGWATILLVDDAELIECSIGRRNEFYGPMRIIIDKGASIGKMNSFICGGGRKIWFMLIVDFYCQRADPMVNGRLGMVFSRNKSAPERYYNLATQFYFKGFLKGIK